MTIAAVLWKQPWWIVLNDRHSLFSSSCSVMPDLFTGREQDRYLSPDCPHIRFNLQRPRVNGYELRSPFSPSVAHNQSDGGAFTSHIVFVFLVATTSTTMIIIKTISKSGKRKMKNI